MGEALDILDSCTDDELQFLVDIILQKGDLTESLTGEDEYKRNKNHPTKYVKYIKKEILDFGSNTFWFQVDYNELLSDVCDKMDVTYRSSDSIYKKEECLLEKVFEGIWQELSEEDRLAILQGLTASDNWKTKVLLKFAAKEVFSKYRSQIFRYLMASCFEIVEKNALKLIGKATARTLGLKILTKGFWGYIGWIWPISDIAGPAYRVTVPCVIYVALLRRKKEA